MRAAAAVLILLSGCPSSQTPRAAPAPTGPRALLPSGTAIRLQLAVTDEERAQGLMFREFLPPDEGMLFLFGTLEVRPFWMKNCHFPLDMVFTLSDGTIVDVLEGVPPCEKDPCPTYPPKAKANTVLEVNAGVAARNGAVPGAKLRFVGVPGR